MRTNKRTVILDAAFEVIQHEGVRAMTYEAIACKTGLTKGGLLYHFPTRENLLQALHERLAELWNSRLTGYLDVDFDETSLEQRLSAYVQSTSYAATRAELLLLLETVEDQDVSPMLNEILKSWTPGLPTMDDPAEMDAFVARLAADGLWLYESLTSHQLSVEQRERVIDHILTSKVRR